MANATVTVFESDGTTETDVVVLDVGRQAAAASKSAALSDEDKTVLDAIATSLAIIDDVGRAAAATSLSVATCDEDKAVLDSVSAKVATRFVTVSMTTPADAQDAGDVIAATQIVAACTPANDVPSVLQSACLIDTDDVGVNIKAVFFSANTTLGTEDSAPDIDDTEALTVLGIVDFAAADYVDLGGSKYNTKTGIGLAMVPASGTDDVYMALYSPTGGTWASGVITVRLGFI
jgi:hypothetical protein